MSVSDGGTVFVSELFWGDDGHQDEWDWGATLWSHFGSSRPSLSQSEVLGKRRSTLLFVV